MSSVKQKADADKANFELIATLKLKVKDLETEVSTLRSRLDDLRKAKNTTITKREREVLEVGFKRDPKVDAKISELERKLRELTAAKNKEIEDLKASHAAELEDALKKLRAKHAAEMDTALKNERAKHEAELQKALKGQKDMEKELNDLRKKLAAEMKEMEERLRKEQANACNHGPELQALRKKISELEDDKVALTMENSDLKERATSLVTDLSIKEAQWCEAEEKYKLQLKQGSGDRYAEWMAETERKIQELQEANAILRTYLHRSGAQLPAGMGGE